MITNYRSQSKRFIYHLFLAGGIFAGPIAARAAAIADSVANFSGTQGQNNWFYGYYTGSFTPSNFTLMTQFVTNAWNVNDQLYYTLLTDSRAHPQGTITSGGRTPIEQWAVRRWVSPVAGTFSLSLVLADLNAAGGNGVVAHIFRDNTEVYAHTVNNGDTSDFNATIPITVSVGTKLDFAIDPRNSDDLFDTTKFTAVITPEPSATLLLLSSLVPFALLRRRATEPSKIASHC